MEREYYYVIPDIVSKYITCFSFENDQRRAMQLFLCCNLSPRFHVFYVPIRFCFIVINHAFMCLFKIFAISVILVHFNIALSLLGSFFSFSNLQKLLIYRTRVKQIFKFCTDTSVDLVQDSISQYIIICLLLL